MSEVIAAKKTLAKVKKDLLRYSAYTSLNAGQISVCMLEITKLEASIARMQGNLCLDCGATGKLSVYFFFSRRCKKCCGDGHMLHVIASRAVADEPDQDC